jgi:carboxypeptidase PM20D1
VKKPLLAVAGLALLGAFILFRAFTAFPDRQLQDVAPLPDVAFDETALAGRLAAAIRIRTISHDDRSRFDGGAFLDLHALLERSFPRVHEAAEREVVAGYSLLYRLEGTDPGLKPALFMGHMDVVPVDEATADAWAHDPFSGDIVDGVIWGRGAMDDKVTVMALLEALERLLGDGRRPARTVYLAFGHDEEVGGKDGAAAIAALLAERGVEFEFVLDEGGAVTEGFFPGVEQPVAIIGIAEKGYVNLHLTVNAAGGHSSQPPPHTAAGILAQAIVRVEANPFPADLSTMDANFAYLGHYFPLTTRIALANRWLLGPVVKRQLLSNPSTAASIRTTTAVNMLEGSSKSNILPTRATAVVNFRILPGDSSAYIRERIVKIIDDPRVEVTASMVNEPSPVSATDSFGFALLQNTIQAQDGDVLVAPYLVQGGTDAKHFVGLSDSVYRFVMIRANRETMRRIHGVNEQITVADYLRAVRFYHALMSRLHPQGLTT